MRRLMFFRKTPGIILAALVLLVLSTPVVVATSHDTGMQGMDATTHAQMNQSGQTDQGAASQTQMTPSDQMNRQMAQRDGKPVEIQLDNNQQNLMLASVAAVFIIIPVGGWIITHQRKRSRKKAEV